MRTTYMRQCQRCKKMFCRDCMTPDVATGDPNAMLCLHCARRIVAPLPKGKYDGLGSHLKFRAAFTDNVKLTFARIDGLIGSNLPMNAYRDPTWWSNTSTSIHAKAWLDAGWEIQEVNFKEGTLSSKKSATSPSKNPNIKNWKLLNPSRLYLCISQNLRYLPKPKCQNSMHESKILSDNEPCPVNPFAASNPNHNIKNASSKTTKNHNNNHTLKLSGVSPCLNEPSQLEISEAYAKVKNNLSVKGCKIVSETPSTQMTIQQGSLWGISPKNAKKTVTLNFSASETATKVSAKSRLSSDWKNLDVDRLRFCRCFGSGLCLDGQRFICLYTYAARWVFGAGSFGFRRQLQCCKRWRAL